VVVLFETGDAPDTLAVCPVYSDQYITLHFLGLFFIFEKIIMIFIRILFNNF